jgi:hypothetical protein
MKKTNIYISLALVLSVLFSSCSKDILNTPAPNISDESYFSSDDAAISALIGVYDPLSRYESTQIHEWMLGDVVSDDAEKGGEGPNDQAYCQELKEFRANAENQLLTARWTDAYIGINRANKLIEGIKGNDNITEATQDIVIAEAKFLRAYFHFQLTKVFGKVPVVTKVLQPSEFQNPQNEITEVYAQIEQDLKDAASKLPYKKDLTVENLGRATKGAANAMLVKMYVFQQKWSEAATLSDEIINGGDYIYSLEPEYADIFTSKGENGVESIFEIQHISIAGDGEWGDDNEGTVTSIFQGTRQLYVGGEIESSWGWGFNLPTQDLVDEFESGDLRKVATILDDHTIVFAGTDNEEEICTQHINSIGYSNKVYHSLKYYIPASERNDMSDSPANWRVIRYADLLLWNAEAKANGGGDGNWQTPLNEVRNRAGLANTISTDGISAIAHERRVELAMEGHRYWDLVRTGKAEEKLGANGYNENKKFLPIPQKEMALNPNLVQNPY